ncbi:MAG: HAD-IC family P-type ATPase [Anaerolineae bacterium]|nr:HAD-IC family P-type ATPase [Anaerolineae bacterium]MCO5192867.1 HAD-IC family P-type ATPase [Anaerolineae bacterium]
MALTGLTSAQVAERRRQGQGNDVKLATSRTYKDIVLKNVFNPVNVVLYAIGLAMFAVGDGRSAFATIMLVLFNSTVGIIQEVRSKRKLDEIALLAIAKVTVLRDGQETQINPSELVLGDILVVRAGDQIPVDGKILGDSRIEVDESALTGESDLIPKSAEDDVLSGSFIVTGQTQIEATGVGEKSFANNLTKNAREFSSEYTPLQREVNRILRILLLLVVFFGILAVLGLFVLDLPFSAWLQIMAVITGSVSAGLLTLIILNYSWGAVRIGQKGGLVQQLNAIESLSNVTVLCTDKTGTLTANKIKYHDVYPIGIDKATLERYLGAFAASASSSNKTSEALLEGLAGQNRPISDEVPFSSARKWSAVAFDEPSLRGTFVMGALEMLEQQFTMTDDARHQVAALSEQGLRVLVFAHNPTVTTLHDGDDPVLPPLTLLGIVSFSDELRPHLQETLSAFTDNNVKLKVISGDNPQTVAALARQAGLPGDLKAVSGPDLAKMGDAEFAQTAADATVFGRITPEQKEALVTTLRNQGEYVAMIGDGVNDVLSLKKANMGIAMESGSTATRSVAAMILLGDSFGAMPAALGEGQRIVSSIQAILKLFMVTVFALLLLIIGVTILNLGFPFTALQNTLLSFFARGAPPFILGLTAIASAKRTTLSRNILHFTLPASFMLFLFGLLVYMGAFFLVEQGLVNITITPEMISTMEKTLSIASGTLSDEEFYQAAILLSAQTALTTFFVFTGITLMLFAAPPGKWWSGGSDYEGRNWLVVAGAVLLYIGYVIVLVVPALRIFFQLLPLPISFHITIAILTVLWVFVQRFLWRSNWMERFLDIDVERDTATT